MAALDKRSSGDTLVIGGPVFEGGGKTVPAYLRKFCRTRSLIVEHVPRGPPTQKTEKIPLGDLQETGCLRSESQKPISDSHIVRCQPTQS
ncbi:MAG: hypothetical protein CMJ62_16635 [Planctomycetaceae bacterium]|nr:hypothetical protein [Planctomycetaceae bacterium]